MTDNATLDATTVNGRALAFARMQSVVQSSGGFCGSSLALFRLEDLVHDLGAGGDHRAQFTPIDDPSPAAAVTRRKSRRRLCDSYGVPTAVVNTSPCSCHSAPAVERSSAWRRTCSCSAST